MDLGSVWIWTLDRYLSDSNQIDRTIKEEYGIEFWSAIPNLGIYREEIMHEYQRQEN